MYGLLGEGGGGGRGTGRHNRLGRKGAERRGAAVQFGWRAEREWEKVGRLPKGLTLGWLVRAGGGWLGETDS